MPIIQGTETVVDPLQRSALSKKGLCDYVINLASGCIHGCTFCYVPSTPVIRARQGHLREKGIENPQLEWGQYLLIRQEIPEKLETCLSKKKSWVQSPPGRGVVLLCSGTDPYQNQTVAQITRQAVEVLLKHDKRVRILTRSPLWLNDIDLLSHPNVTLGMSLPYLDNELSRQIEPKAPPPSQRFKALLEGKKQGCRIYIAMAPTVPMMTVEHFKVHLDKTMTLDPEVIFWEPINARGTNGKRMLAAGLDFVDSVMERKAWAAYFTKQWFDIENAALDVGCIQKIHVWPDFGLETFIPQPLLELWWNRPTVEKWGDSSDTSLIPPRPLLRDFLDPPLALESSQKTGNANQAKNERSSRDIVSAVLK
jgi:DNA repair photolyase